MDVYSYIPDLINGRCMVEAKPKRHWATTKHKRHGFSIAKQRVAQNLDTEVAPESQTDKDMEPTSTEHVNTLCVLLDNNNANLSIDTP